MLEAGNPVTVVCSRHGISHSIFYLWMQKADEAAEADDHTSDFFGFSDKVRASQARAEEKALKIVWDAAKGGRKVTKTVVKRRELVRQEPDPDWGPGSERQRQRVETDRTLLEEETTITTYETLPNPNLARWFLERRNRKEWGSSLALTGANGTGPVRYRDESAPGLDFGKLNDDELDTLEQLYEKAERGEGTADELAADPGGEGPP